MDFSQGFCFCFEPVHFSTKSALNLVMCFPVSEARGSSLPLKCLTSCASQRLSSKYFLFCFSFELKKKSKLNFDVNIYFSIGFRRFYTTCLKQHVQFFRNLFWKLNVTLSSRYKPGELFVFLNSQDLSPCFCVLDGCTAWLRAGQLPENFWEQGEDRNKEKFHLLGEWRERLKYTRESNFYSF